MGGVDLSAALNLGATFTDVPGGTASWTFTGGTNYNDQNGDAVIAISKANASVTVCRCVISSGVAVHGDGGIGFADGDDSVVISKANALVTVNGYTGTYDAAAHGASGTASGVGGVDPSASLNRARGHR